MKLFLLSLFLAFFISAGLYSQPAVDKSLIIGTASGYAPYVSLDPNGKYEGFDIEFAERLAGLLDRKLVIKDFGTMPSLLLALKQKKVDALIWAIGITKERMEKMEMVYYQGEKTTGLPFLFWERIPDEITSLASLGDDPKSVVAIEAGSSQEEILKKFPKINLKYKDSITDAILEIKYGKAFTTTIDPSLIALIKNRFPEIKVLNLPLPPDEYTLGNGICLNKSDPALVLEVKQAVTQLISDGTIAELEKKWNLGKK